MHHPKIRFVEPGPPVSPRDLEAFEARIGARLPDDYRAYLLRYNGAQPLLEGAEQDGCVVRVRWDGKAPRASGSAASFEGFLGLLPAPGVVPDLAETWNEFRGRIPKETIPIGRDPGGSLFLLVLYGPSRGSILFWSRRYEGVEDAGLASESEGAYANVGFLAPSFTGLLDALEPEPTDWEAWESQAR